MALVGAKITNFNIENVLQVAPNEFPKNVADSFRLPLVLPNTFHKYGLFSKALYLQAALIGYILAECDSASGDIRIVGVKVLKSFEGFGFEDLAVRMIREEMDFVRSLEWKKDQTVSGYVNGRHFPSVTIARLQTREALGDLKLGKLIKAA